MSETERGTFEVFTAGTGDPVCVTHLYSAFNERGNYFADTLTEAFEVYLVNLKGAGNSEPVKDEQDMSMESGVRDLEAVRKSLGLSRWAFAGHSTGGMLGLVYAIVHPESLTKLLAGGAAASNEYMKHEGSMYSPASPLNKRVLACLKVLQSTESTTDERKAAGREWTEMSLYAPENYDQYFSQPSSGSVVKERLDYYSFKELPDFDLRDSLKKVQIPAWIYCGRHDTQCPHVFSEEIAALIPGARLITFEKSNHSPFLEEKELFCDMVNSFREKVRTETITNENIHGGEPHEYRNLSNRHHSRRSGGEPAGHERAL
ncbi:alpha/beta fold hydrolase [Alteribacter natronophilus]|uniref:alpha/beta fold hydrolase n=1 Tax=Alteribacter natronophilus TaxID=2583810 RepID=UPI00110E5D7F|nr:alpha/beta fold hydrolase [Alteribacter natronophilus]TMW71007.1 alpha/beta fold hydrolase [Alteribacter natronophilus]